MAALGFRFRLVSLSAASLLAAVMLTAYLAHANAIEQLEESLAAELLAVVNTGAPLIDGDLHERIHRGPDGSIVGLEDFERLRDQLRTIRDATRLRSFGSPIYTMRKSEGYEQSRLLEFVVMTDPDDEGRYFVGNRYRAQRHNRAALEGRSATSGLYSDSEGTWISAAAPIRDHTGRVVGLLQADRSVAFFTDSAREHALEILGFGCLAALLGVGLVMVFAGSLTKPIHRLVAAARAIGTGGLHHRVTVDRSDELGALAEAFNQMADSLQLHNENLEVARREAETANRGKSEFLVNVSREIRTPVGDVIAAAGELLEVGLEEKQERLVMRMRESAATSQALIDAILDCSRMDAGGLELEVTHFDPKALVDDLVERMTPLAEAKALHIFTVHHRDAPATWEGDASRIEKIVHALIDNAIAFTEKGYISISVGAEADADQGSMLLVRVTDTGVGIPKDALERIFERFERSGDEREGSGTGLGLAVARQLAELMGGGVTVRSTPGKGSTFSLKIPIASR